MNPLRKPCKYCEKIFQPTTNRCKICGECYKESIKRATESRRIKNSIDSASKQNTSGDKN